jgi:hypothetical protein
MALRIASKFINYVNVASCLDKIADKLEPLSMRLAFALDCISDRLDRTASGRWVDNLFAQFSQAYPELKGDASFNAFWKYVNSNPQVKARFEQELKK